MFDLADKIADEVVDDVRPLLDVLASRKSWNDATKLALSELKKILKDNL